MNINQQTFTASDNFGGQITKTQALQLTTQLDDAIEAVKKFMELKSRMEKIHQMVIEVRQLAEAEADIKECTERVV